MPKTLETLTKSAGGIIINADARIAIVTEWKAIKKRKKKKEWERFHSFPKGHVEDDDDDDLAAALREIFEETGISKEELELIDELGSIERENTTGDEWKEIRYYLFRTNRTEKMSPVDKNIIEATWRGRREVSSMLHHKPDIDLFEQHVTKKLLRKLGVL